MRECNQEKEDILKHSLGISAVGREAKSGTDSGAMGEKKTHPRSPTVKRTKEASFPLWMVQFCFLCPSPVAIAF